MLPFLPEKPETPGSCLMVVNWNSLTFNEVKCKVLHLSQNNPKHEYSLGNEWIDSSPVAGLRLGRTCCYWWMKNRKCIDTMCLSLQLRKAIVSWYASKVCQGNRLWGRRVLQRSGVLGQAGLFFQHRGRKKSSVNPGSNPVKHVKIGGSTDRRDQGWAEHCVTTSKTKNERS